MTNRPASVSVALFFVLLNALVWLAFGIIVGAGALPSIPQAGLVRWGMAILALLTAGLLVGLWAFLRKRSRLAYYLTLGLLVVISLLTAADQFGLSDLIVLIINLVPLVLLIKDRAWYLRRCPGHPERE